MAMKIDGKTKEMLLKFQKSEITEHLVYKRLAEKVRGKNREILETIAGDELRHYNILKKYTQSDVSSGRLAVMKHSLLMKLFGLTFTAKLMERDEGYSRQGYEKLIHELPEFRAVIRDEHVHEKKLIGMIEEEKLEYIGSMVLGLNDALVELTGALAGLTFALQSTVLVAMAGLITGVAAAMSMASSEYLSKKSDAGSKSPRKAAVYTGIAYIMTVLFLVFPYFVFSSFYTALGMTIMNAVIVIAIFTYFISVTKDLSFRTRFLEMLAISMGIAAISFAFGLAVKTFLGV